jgi:hypothetical protein
MSVRVIFHHTAGHHPEIENPQDESRAEAIRYALAIQHAHTTASPTDPSKPWLDSGHNFLVCRNGLVLQGRWLTVSTIEAGLMVRSAHCPGQNAQIGIEHEHAGSEPMTPAQREASAQLQAWIARCYRKVAHVLPAAPHSAYFNTACPANLRADVQPIVARANALLQIGQT